MKHIIKNIALGAALLPVAAVAQTEKEYTDSVASQVNVAFRTVNEADLMGGVSTVNMVEQAKKDYTTYSLDGMDALVGGYNGQLWNQGEALVLVDGVPRDANNVWSIWFRYETGTSVNNRAFSEIIDQFYSYNYNTDLITVINPDDQVILNESAAEWSNYTIIANQEIA